MMDGWMNEWKLRPKQKKKMCRSKSWNRVRVRLLGQPPDARALARDFLTLAGRQGQGTTASNKRIRGGKDLRTSRPS